MTIMFTRLLPPPKQSFFLLGPRGVGKTTWIEAHFPRATRYNLLDEALYQRFLQDSALFGRELAAVASGSWVVVDEVQRLPWILNEVHRFIEERKLKFALTSSSARKLKAHGTNLLAGRALRRAMYPLAPSELAGEFSLEKVLKHGSIPLVWVSEDPRQTLDAYARMYLKEEIQAEALVRNLPGFARFLPVAALFHGQSLNVASLARDSGTARTTINGYLEVLEDTLVAHRLSAYEGGLRVREKKHPKLYWIDPGLVRTLKRARGAVLPEERGPLLEGYVHMLLRLARDYFDAFDEMYYWAPAEAQKTEVDFVLERGKERIAIEVKATDRVRDEHFSGLRAIDGLKGLSRRILVHLGDRSMKTADKIEAMPFSKFAAELEKI